MKTLGVRRTGSRTVQRRRWRRPDVQRLRQDDGAPSSMSRQLPANTCGNPMTYMVNNKQYIVVAVGAQNFPAELVALSLP